MLALEKHWMRCDPRLYLSFAFGLMLLASPANANSLEHGEKAYKGGNYVSALAILKSFAEDGNAKAQYLLGKMSANGKGSNLDRAAAVNWYRRAADQGNADAQFKLGDMLLKRRRRGKEPSRRLELVSGCCFIVTVGKERV
jgi:Sel1 repeat